MENKRFPGRSTHLSDGLETGDWGRTDRHRLDLFRVCGIGGHGHRIHILQFLQLFIKRSYGRLAPASRFAISENSHAGFSSGGDGHHIPEIFPAISAGDGRSLTPRDHRAIRAKSQAVLCAGGHCYDGGESRRNVGRRRIGSRSKYRSVRPQEEKMIRPGCQRPNISQAGVGQIRIGRTGGDELGVYPIRITPNFDGSISENGGTESIPHTNGVSIRSTRK